MTWWPDLAWPGSEICTTCAEKMYHKVCQKRRRCAPPYLSYSRKTLWGGVQTPPPSGARVKYRYSIFVLCNTWSITTTMNANHDVLVSGLAIHWTSFYKKFTQVLPKFWQSFSSALKNKACSNFLPLFSILCCAFLCLVAPRIFFRIFALCFAYLCSLCLMVGNGQRVL